MCNFCQMVAMRHPEVQKIAIMMYVPLAHNHVIALTQQVIDTESIISYALHDLCFIHNKWPCIAMNVREYVMLNYDAEWFPDSYFFKIFANDSGHVRKIIIQDTMILFGKYAAVSDKYVNLPDQSWITIQRYISGLTPILHKTLKAVNVNGLV